MNGKILIDRMCLKNMNSVKSATIKARFFLHKSDDMSSSDFASKMRKRSGKTIDFDDEKFVIPCCLEKYYEEEVDRNDSLSADLLGLTDSLEGIRKDIAGSDSEEEESLESLIYGNDAKKEKSESDSDSDSDSSDSDSDSDSDSPSGTIRRTKKSKKAVVKKKKKDLDDPKIEFAVCTRKRFGGEDQFGLINFVEMEEMYNTFGPKSYEFELEKNELLCFRMEYTSKEKKDRKEKEEIRAAQEKLDREKRVRKIMSKFKKEEIQKYLQFLTMDDVWRVRRVCKAWKEAVDTFESYFTEYPSPDTFLPALAGFLSGPMRRFKQVENRHLGKGIAMSGFKDNFSKVLNRGQSFKMFSVYKMADQHLLLHFNDPTLIRKIQIVTKLRVQITNDYPVGQSLAKFLPSHDDTDEERTVTYDQFEECKELDFLYLKFSNPLEIRRLGTFDFKLFGFSKGTLEMIEKSPVNRMIQSEKKLVYFYIIQLLSELYNNAKILPTQMKVLKKKTEWYHRTLLNFDAECWKRLFSLFSPKGLPYVVTQKKKVSEEEEEEGEDDSQDEEEEEEEEEDEDESSDSDDSSDSSDSEDESSSDSEDESSSDSDGSEDEEEEEKKKKRKKKAKKKKKTTTKKVKKTKSIPAPKKSTEEVVESKSTPSIPLPGDVKRINMVLDAILYLFSTKKNRDSFQGEACGGYKTMFKAFADSLFQQNDDLPISIFERFQAEFLEKAPNDESVLLILQHMRVSDGPLKTRQQASMKILEFLSKNKEGLKKEEVVKHCLPLMQSVKKEVVVRVLEMIDGLKLTELEYLNCGVIKEWLSVLQKKKVKEVLWNVLSKLVLIYVNCKNRKDKVTLLQYYLTLFTKYTSSSVWVLRSISEKDEKVFKAILDLRDEKVFPKVMSRLGGDWLNSLIDEFERQKEGSKLKETRGTELLKVLDEFIPKYVFDKEQEKVKKRVLRLLLKMYLSKKLGVGLGKYERQKGKSIPADPRIKSLVSQLLKKEKDLFSPIDTLCDIVKVDFGK